MADKADKKTINLSESDTKILLSIMKNLTSDIPVSAFPAHLTMNEMLTTDPVRRHSRRRRVRLQERKDRQGRLESPEEGQARCHHYRDSDQEDDAGEEAQGWRGG